jgi:hypothetical protein
MVKMWAVEVTYCDELRALSVASDGETLASMLSEETETGSQKVPPCFG